MEHNPPAAWPPMNNTQIHNTPARLDWASCVWPSSRRGDDKLTYEYAAATGPLDGSQRLQPKPRSLDGTGDAHSVLNSQALSHGGSRSPERPEAS